MTLLRFGLAMLLWQPMLPVLHSGEIAGSVVIPRKLTKRNVTAAAGAYQRGAGAELAADPEMDDLEFEQTQVVVYLEGPPTSSPSQAVLEQKNRRFFPEVLAVPAGSSVTFPNRDAILHNVFSLSKSKAFDLGTYPKNQTRTVKLARPGVIFVHCHLHPNMSAAIVVTPNQWFARPDSSGRFSLQNVPPGSYTAVAWHKTAGAFRQTVQVTDSGSTNLVFVIPPESGS